MYNHLFSYINISLFIHIRSNDSPVAVSLACGSLSGIASSTGEQLKGGILNYILGIPSD